MRRIPSAVLVIALGTTVAAAPEGEPRPVAAEVLRTHGAALAAVKLTVVHRTLVGKKEVRREEHAVEVTGTVVRADGTVAVAASALDFLPTLPAAAPLPLDDLSTEFELGKPRLVFANGRDVPARLLGRDAARDLAFVQPLEKPGQLHAIPPDGGPPPGAADGVIIVYPLSRSLGRRPAVARRSVSAVVEGKDPLAVLDTSERRHLGCPVFDRQGRALGIAATVRAPQKPHEYLANIDNLEPDLVIRDLAAVKKSLAEVEGH